METDPNALEEGKRLLDMESPSKRRTGSPAHKEIAAGDKSQPQPLGLTGTGKIKKLSNSAITSVDVVPDPTLNSGPGEPSKNSQNKIERILTEQVPQKKKLGGSGGTGSEFGYGPAS
jgi:hypothetical protein